MTAAWHRAEAKRLRREAKWNFVSAAAQAVLGLGLITYAILGFLGR